MKTKDQPVYVAPGEHDGCDWCFSESSKTETVARIFVRVHGDYRMLNRTTCSVDFCRECIADIAGLIEPC